MAGITNITAGDMRCALATGRYTFVTKHTVTDKGCMIRRNTIETNCGQPACRPMAKITLFDRLNMRG